MSVFTPLTDQDIRLFLDNFNVGTLVHCAGIDGGSENTNYFVDTRTENGNEQSFVLTLVERPVQDLGFFIGLLACLHQANLPVPYSLEDRDSRPLHEIKGRPALLQPRLPGRHPDRPCCEQCASLGQLIAALHDASSANNLQRKNDRGPDWVLNNAGKLLATIWQNDAVWLIPALTQLQHWFAKAPALPQTVIHGDLFRDNVMFQDTTVSGVIDFYNAATGWTLMELAICVNDWCVDISDSGVFSIDTERARALINAYDMRRPLDADERASWPYVLQLAALRFWVSRQHYVIAHQGQAGVLIKDPAYFRQLFMLHTRDADTSLLLPQ